MPPRYWRVDRRVVVPDGGRWTLESIQRSWRRAKKLGLTTVNRNEFLTVFTDLTVIRQSKFLALPLEVFEYFIAEEDRDVRVLLRASYRGCAGVVSAGRNPSGFGVAAVAASLHVHGPTLRSHGMAASSCGLQVPPHAQRVVVREVLAVLGLFCSGSPTAQLRFSFQLFDDDNSKSMTIVRAAGAAVAGR